jgi:DNA-binding CsgD family transcriptional regulator
VDESSLYRLVLFTIPSIVGALLCLGLAFALAKKPSALQAWFLCFYLLSVLDLVGAAIAPAILGGGAMGFRRFSEIGLAIVRLRYLFLILFAHSFRRFRATGALTVLLSAVVAAGIAAPFFIYSIIPSLMEIAAVAYSFTYLSCAYLARGRIGLAPRVESLLKAILACSGFFLLGIILDLVEEIPAASVYVSVLLMDFHPVYVVCIGAVMASWALSGALGKSAAASSAAEAARERAGAAAPALDPSSLPISRREREVAALILSGETNASIADKLFISESTVKKHVNNIFRKLGISSRWELVKLTGGLLPRE